jgi:hypothetical protein
MIVLRIEDSMVLNGHRECVFQGCLNKVRMASKMTAEKRAFDLSISDAFFRLVTESIRLMSNKVKQTVSISDVVNDRSSNAPNITSVYKPESLREHLRIIPTDGDVGLSITILDSSSKAINGSIPDLEKAVGGSVSFASAVSLVLFDFIVEENTTEVINKLGLDVADAEAFRAAAKRTETNVIPIR